MGRMKQLLFRDNPAFDIVSLEDLAVRLKGEVDGRYVLCASPGLAEDDRSCCVRIDPGQPETFFVYYCEGPEGRAYASIRAALGLVSQDRRAENKEMARKLWSETVPAAGTAVEAYLRSRGISLPIPVAIRFHGRLKHRSGSHWPAMVTEVRDESGHLCAIHRTFLDYSHPRKAPVEPQKMTLGPVAGGSARLALPADKIVIAEGIETTLSAMQLSGLPGWAGLSTGGLKSMRLPPEVRAVAIAADNGDPGERAAQIASRRFIMEGRTATIARPRVGNDFNDVLCALVRP